MKIYKKTTALFISFLIAVSMLTAFPVSVAALAPEEPGEGDNQDLWHDISSDGNYCIEYWSCDSISIRRYYGECEVVDIPSEIDGFKVIDVGDSAFLNKSFITSVTIPDSVTSIGENAFSGCSNLSQITLSDSVKSIGVNAFEGIAENPLVKFKGLKADWKKIDPFGSQPYRIIYLKKLPVASATRMCDKLKQKSKLTAYLAAGVPGRN